MGKNSEKFSFTNLLGLTGASMIGSGIFSTTGYSLAELRSPHLVILVWIAGALYSFVGLFVYSKAIKKVSESGGEYKIVSSLVGKGAGLFCGLVSIVAGFVGPLAISAQTIDKYNQSGSIGLIIMCTLFFIELTTEKISIWLQNIVVLTKSIGIIVLILLAIFVQGSSLNYDVIELQPNWGGLFSALTWVLFSYSGWNSFCYIYDEITDKEKVYLRAPYIALAAVSILYILINCVFLFMLPLDEIMGKAEVGIVLANKIGGERLVLFTRYLITLALASMISSMFMMGPVVFKSFFTDVFKKNKISKKIFLILQFVLAFAVYKSTTLIQAIGAMGGLLIASMGLVTWGVILNVPLNTYEKLLLYIFLLVTMFICFKVLSESGIAPVVFIFLILFFSLVKNKLLRWM